jgi:hypothetical protein
MLFQKDVILPHELGDIVDLGVSLGWDVNTEEGIDSTSLEVLQPI